MTASMLLTSVDQWILSFGDALPIIRFVVVVICILLIIFVAKNNPDDM